MINIEKQPLTAILDGDIIAYKAAFWAESEGCEDLPLRIAHDVKQWTPEGILNIKIAFSCSRANNFRRKVWDPYKRHRDINRQTPTHLAYAEELLRAFPTVRYPNIEADDLMGIAASSYKAIAVTIDKDLRSTRGWHWNPDKEEQPCLLDARTANFNFHSQWLTGDSTDNIPGIWKCGPVKARKILESVEPQFWTEAVLATYESSLDVDKNPYSKECAIQMAQCVRILQKDEYNFKTNTPKLWVPNE